MTEYLAYIYIKRFDTNEVVEKIGITRLTDRSVMSVLFGLIRQMDTERFYIDDDEVMAKLKEIEEKTA